MIREYFPPARFRHEMTGTALCAPRDLFRQERDWTCGVACLRTLMSGIVPVPSETLFVFNNHLTPGPLYSRDFKTLTGSADGAFPALLNPRLEVRYGCDDPERDALDESDVWVWLRDGWRVAVDWMMSFDHWCVIMGYFPLGSPREHEVVFYDPYYDDIRLAHAPDLGVMWRSGRDPGLVHDYVLMRENPALG